MVCNHSCTDKNTSLKTLPKFKFLGMLNYPKIAICTCCKENIKLTDEEYENLKLLQEKN